VRIVRRLALALFWTLACAVVQAVLLSLPGRGKEAFARFYWRGIAGCLGLRLRVEGRLATDPPLAARPVLFVVNHCSWLDIVALGAVLPGCFVAKADVAGWPGIGTVARLGRTVFVSRTRVGTGRERDVLGARLAAGDNLILFPEGTTSNGSLLLPFNSTFLAIAERDPRPLVQPVTIVYDELDGLPLRRHHRPSISWYGDMDLAPHLATVGRHASIGARIVLHEPVPPGSFRNRKALAASLEGLIACEAASLRTQRREPSKKLNGLFS
jgi:lyso-ornithine lipid O-acyltransferase